MTSDRYLPPNWNGMLIPTVMARLGEPRRSAPWVRCHSESPWKSSYAHLFEHLMFRGTENYTPGFSLFNY